ncbi:hypothetical protein Pcinc_039717 [Petrolisthes cinctipes]|uniref:Uncharacterized protein n=1 Tax=Petrolisthes cinctipes TaxID=88211 RepID=A0AAE1BP84_PETCI|nr:hypothetical protein Pcinc_039717 [Petrolisthes cinctipes]
MSCELSLGRYKLPIVTPESDKTSSYSSVCTHRSVSKSEHLTVKRCSLAPDDGDVGGVEVVEEVGQRGGVWCGGRRLCGGRRDVDTRSEPTRRPR